VGDTWRDRQRLKNEHFVVVVVVVVVVVNVVVKHLHTNISFFSLSDFCHFRFFCSDQRLRSTLLLIRVVRGGLTCKKTETDNAIKFLKSSNKKPVT
jgi:trimethylamine:corrinoid methyltransferase-like protein